MTRSTKIIAALGIAAGLGVAALPLNSFAESTKDVTVRVNIPSSINIGGDDDPSNPGGNAGDVTPGDQGDGESNLVVSTNDPNGLSVNVKDKDSTTALTRSGADVSGAVNTIPAMATLPTAAGSAGWNITSSTEGVESAFNTGVAISTSNTLVYRSTSATAPKNLNMHYNIKTAENQAEGVYTDVITYTVSVNSAP